MNWPDVFTFLVVIFAIMLVCGLLGRLFGRRLCRPRAWNGRTTSSREFGCCCSRPGRRGENGTEPAPPRGSDVPLAKDGR